MDEWRGMDLFKGSMKMRFQSCIINGNTVNTVSFFCEENPPFLSLLHIAVEPFKLGSFFHRYNFKGKLNKLRPSVVTYRIAFLDFFSTNVALLQPCRIIFHEANLPWNKAKSHASIRGIRKKRNKSTTSKFISGDYDMKVSWSSAEPKWHKYNVTMLL